jgi:hypothetical protein
MLHKQYTDELLNYEVTISDNPITLISRLRFNKTATVNFFNLLGKITRSIDLGYRESHEIYRLIDEKKEINLDNCYVKNFSLSEYRRLRNLSEQSKITLSAFTAKNAFFDCDIEIDFSYCLFEGDETNFESSVFGNGLVNFSGADFGHGDASFKGTQFGDGRIDFHYVEFGSGNVTFKYSNFGHGDISFVNTDFSHGNVDFRIAVFGDGNVDFKFAKFSSGDVSFEKAVFGKGDKDFKTVEFGGGTIDFRRVNFGNGNVSFEATEFGNGKVTFKSAKFGEGDIFFDNTDFGTGDTSFEQVEFGNGKVSFKNAKVMNISFQSCQLNSYLDLRFAACNLINLKDTIVRDIIDLRPHSSLVDVKELNITGMKNLGRIYIDWKANNATSLIYNQQNTSYAEKAEQFIILKEDFSSTGLYTDEDYAYVEFKRCEGKAQLDTALAANTMNAIWAYPAYWFKWLVFDKMGLYATAPMRVLSSMVVVYFLFGLVYVSFPYFTNGHIYSALGDPDKLSSFEVGFYFSGVTFFTIGYGDYYPSGIFRAIAVFEGFTGVFLMAYFTVAFVRKILR